MTCEITCGSPATPNVGATSAVKFPFGKYWRYTSRNAELTAICFPGEYASLKDRPYYEEVIQSLRQN